MLKKLCPEFIKLLLQRRSDIPCASTDSRYDCTSVFFLIYYKDKTPYLLAILKSDTPGYAWRNQVALPGGHIEEQDRNSLAGAFRELKEEIGISEKFVEYIGSLGHFQTIQNKDIEVFLGIWKGDFDSITYDKKEISKVIEIPIEALLETHISKNFHGHIPDIGELLYPFGDVVIWGVTARIFHYFFELLLTGMDDSSIKEWQQSI